MIDQAHWCVLPFHSHTFKRWYVVTK